MQPQEPLVPNDTPEESKPELTTLNEEKLLTAHTAWRHYKKRWIFVILSLIALILAGAYFLGHRQTKPTATSNNTTSFQAASGSKLCFVRYGYVVCENSDGSGRVRYDLPTVGGGITITNVVVNLDGSEFVAYGNDGVNNGMWLLNNKLEVVRQLTFPDGMTALTPSFSHDGKSLLLELDPQGATSTRQIYRYDLATGRAIQLTTTGYNTQPYETKDGHILYRYLDGQHAWSPYIMNSDGTNALPLNGVPTNSPSDGANFSYDAATDMVYVLGSGNTLSYGTVSAFLAAKPISRLTLPTSSGSTEVVRLGADKIALNGLSDTGTVYAVPSGKMLNELPKIGTFIGYLNPSMFSKSTQQTEQPYDLIGNLQMAPTDFQTFIKAAYDKENASCVAGPVQIQGVEMRYAINIQQVVRDSFASTNEGCGDGGAQNLYSKVNGIWQRDLATQDGVDCATVDKYHFTKEIVAQCYDSSSQQLVNNTNP